VAFLLLIKVFLLNPITNRKGKKRILLKLFLVPFQPGQQVKTIPSPSYHIQLKVEYRFMYSQLFLANNGKESANIV